MSSTLFTLWAVTISKRFLCDEGDRILFFVSLTIHILIIAVPLTPFCKRKSRQAIGSSNEEDQPINGRTESDNSREF